MNDRPLLKRRQRAPWAFRALLCLFPVDFTREFGEHQSHSLTGTAPVGFRYVSHHRSSFIIRCTLFQ